jgi:hypothetical protein
MVAVHKTVWLSIEPGHKRGSGTRCVVVVGVVVVAKAGQCAVVGNTATTA